MSQLTSNHFGSSSQKKNLIAVAIAIHLKSRKLARSLIAQASFCNALQPNRHATAMSNI
jgi:hypothetical protein